jgi:hypothetical protein
LKRNSGLCQRRETTLDRRSMKRRALFVVLAAALFVRLPGIGWGLPPTTPQVRTSDLRCSYAFDEDDILTGVAKASVARLDFDPNEYHWGTLHIELVLLALDGAQAVGLFGVPWRSAYYNLVDGDFIRVYVIGRLVAVAAAGGALRHQSFDLHLAFSALRLPRLDHRKVHANSRAAARRSGSLAALQRSFVHWLALVGANSVCDVVHDHGFVFCPWCATRSRTLRHLA